MRSFIHGAIGFLLLVALSPAAAQAPAPPTLVQAMSLTDININLRGAAVSADGTSLAYIWQQQLCLYSFDSRQENCADLPAQFDGFDAYSHLSWSPDGKTLVFTEDPFSRFVDSDIWTYDMATAAFQDRTDDGVSGNWNRAANGSSALIDYQPVWNPVTGDLYFFRSTRTFTGFTTTALERMSLAQNEPEQIADYTSSLPGFSVFKPAIISPDGTQMAIIAVTYNSPDMRNGIYIINLMDGSLDRVMTLDDLDLALPRWSRGVMVPQRVQWVDNNSFVLEAENEIAPSGIFKASYYTDLETRQVTALTDFNDVPNQQVYLVDTHDLSQPAYRMPQQGVVTADGTHYLYIGTGFGGGVGYLFSLNLPPDGQPPVKIGEINPLKTGPVTSTAPIMMPDGRHAAIFGYWLTLQPPA